ncbi:hypothetical protein D3C86_1593970 [compost metagenome]
MLVRECFGVKLVPSSAVTVESPPDIIWTTAPLLSNLDFTEFTSPAITPSSIMKPTILLFIESFMVFFILRASELFVAGSLSSLWSDLASASAGILPLGCFSLATPTPTFFATKVARSLSMNANCPTTLSRIAGMVTFDNSKINAF